MEKESQLEKSINGAIRALNSINNLNFIEIAEIFTSILSQGRAIFWCGNGGSAAESSHMATELLGRFKNNRKPYPSISLNADTTLITCIANDFGFDEIYSRQLEGLSKPGDLLIVLSTSGKSKNIVRRVLYITLKAPQVNISISLIFDCIYQ